MSSNEGPGNIASRRGPTTVCKICDASIFSGDRVEWVTSPRPGLVHAGCSRSKNETT